MQISQKSFLELSIIWRDEDIFELAIIQIIVEQAGIDIFPKELCQLARLQIGTATCTDEITGYRTGQL